MYGWHAVSTLLAGHPQRARRLWLAAGRDDRRRLDLEVRARALGLAVEELPRRDLDRLCAGPGHQGVLLEAVAAQPTGEGGLRDWLQALPPDPLLLVLDQIQDPRNLGACLRSAEGAGVAAVIFPRDRSAPLSAVARKTASGAAELLPLFAVTNLARALDLLREQGIWLFGAAGEAEGDLYQTDLRGPLALVLGSEGQGLRRLTRERCDRLLSIPMQGVVESLNVAVAAGVMLFEARRQRRPGA